MAKVEYKLQNKYNGLMIALRGKARKIKDAELKKAFEMEIGFIDMRIRQYGFDFYPTHYIRDDVRRLEKLLRK